MRKGTNSVNKFRNGMYRYISSIAMEETFYKQTEHCSSHRHQLKAHLFCIFIPQWLLNPQLLCYHCQKFYHNSWLFILHCY